MEFQWLRSKAEEGHVPLLYVMSALTFRENPDESRRLNARGRIALMVDAQECRTDPRTPWGSVLESFQFLGQLRADLGKWYQSVDAAISWMRARTGAPSAAWYCGPDNLIGGEQAAAVRQAAINKIDTFNKENLAKVGAAAMPATPATIAPQRRAVPDSTLQATPEAFSVARAAALALGLPNCDGRATVRVLPREATMQPMTEIWLVEGCGTQRNMRVESMPNGELAVGVAK